MAEFRTLPETFLHRVTNHPGDLAFMHPVGETWQQLSWGQTGERVRGIACGLRAVGVKSQERVAILANTRLDWVLADLAIMCAGAATTTIYPASTPDECAYILKDSETVLCIAEDDKQVQKLLQVRDQVPSLRYVVTLDGKSGHDGFVVSFADLEKQGNEWHAANPGGYEDGIRAVEAEDLATLIYTSGTTGQPKGVELTHDCWVFEGKAIDDMNLLRTDDLQYFWLPLAHSFGKVLEAAQIRIGFATAIDGRIDKLVGNLAVVKPTFIAAVPRIFEKVYNKVISGAKAGGGLKYGIFQWAFGVGRQVSSLVQRGESPSGLLALKAKIADKLVFSKLKTLFGGRVRYFVSGSAPLSRDIAEFFHAAGILILEGYGLTESSAATFVNRGDKYKFGTVGIPVPGAGVKIDPETGEILLSGRGIMRGYHHMPEATAECIVVDADGTRWLKTGDKGEVDGDGFLKITDRIKELIKTSGGKYVAPAFIESKLKVALPLSASVLVHGNNRNFCSALVGFPEEDLKVWAGQNGQSGSYAELLKSPALQSLVQGALDKVNGELPSYSTVKRFAILPQDLSVEGGELTQSLKVKRKVVEGKYKDVLDGFYNNAMESM
ncbi:MAG: long-chain fatty acid--CoA ligase [Deltaproteobacteria bacterium]|nr:long-chain fatty acid--CoA ligase [Deltaproteobacteria bacterium]